VLAGSYTGFTAVTPQVRPFFTGILTMNFTAQAVSYLLSALLVFAWLREHRLRRSFQTLLTKIFTRKGHTFDPHNPPFSRMPGNRYSGSNRRMR
jgi:hypothetical protein